MQIEKSVSVANYTIKFKLFIGTEEEEYHTANKRAKHAGINIILDVVKTEVT